MPLTAGTRLGPYEIVAPLGAGGMGEVYRAIDTRLGRQVAVKVLPEELGSDPERLRRFEQEARAASALNHPNILTLYDVAAPESKTPYLVTELLEGQNLRLVIDRQPMAAVCWTTLQIANGRRGARARDRAPGPQARKPVRDARRPREDPRRAARLPPGR
jgi:serine/threonine protein kinase